MAQGGEAASAAKMVQPPSAAGPSVPPAAAHRRKRLSAATLRNWCRTSEKDDQFPRVSEAFHNVFSQLVTRYVRISGISGTPKFWSLMKLLERFGNINSFDIDHLKKHGVLYVSYFSNESVVKLLCTDLTINNNQVHVEYVDPKSADFQRYFRRRQLPYVAENALYDSGDEVHSSKRNVQPVTEEEEKAKRLKIDKRVRQEKESVPVEMPASAKHRMNDRYEEGGSKRPRFDPPLESNPSEEIKSLLRMPRRFPVRVSNLPLRSKDSNIKEGLYFLCKKYGKVVAVKVVGSGEDRYAIVSFRRREDAMSAASQKQNVTLFNQKVHVELMAEELDEMDDNEHRPLEKDVDQYHPRSSRTLFVGNLYNGITTESLRKQFAKFGHVLDVEIKNKDTPAPFCFIQYTNINSPLAAILAMEIEGYVGANKVKVGFGKPLPTPTVWLDELPCDITETYLMRKMNFYGVIKDVLIDRVLGQSLITYESVEAATAAVQDMKGRLVNNKQLQCDFCSKELYDYVVDHMYMTNQMGPKASEEPVRSADAERHDGQSPAQAKDVRHRYPALPSGRQDSQQPSTSASSHSSKHSRSKGDSTRAHGHRSCSRRRRHHANRPDSPSTSQEVRVERRQPVQQEHQPEQPKELHQNQPREKPKKQQHEEQRQIAPVVQKPPQSVGLELPSVPSLLQVRPPPPARRRARGTLPRPRAKSLDIVRSRAEEDRLSEPDDLMEQMANDPDQATLRVIDCDVTQPMVKEVSSLLDPRLRNIVSQPSLLLPPVYKRIRRNYARNGLILKSWNLDVEEEETVRPTAPSSSGAPPAPSALHAVSPNATVVQPLAMTPPLPSPSPPPPPPSPVVAVLPTPMLISAVDESSTATVGAGGVPSPPTTFLASVTTSVPVTCLPPAPPVGLPPPPPPSPPTLPPSEGTLDMVDKIEAVDMDIALSDEEEAAGESPLMHAQNVQVALETDAHQVDQVCNGEQRSVVVVEESEVTAQEAAPTEPRNTALESIKARCADMQSWLNDFKTIVLERSRLVAQLAPVVVDQEQPAADEESIDEIPESLIYLAAELEKLEGDSVLTTKLSGKQKNWLKQLRMAVRYRIQQVGNVPKEEEENQDDWEEEAFNDAISYARYMLKPGGSLSILLELYHDRTMPDRVVNGLMREQVEPRAPVPCPPVIGPEAAVVKVDRAPEVLVEPPAPTVAVHDVHQPALLVNVEQPSTKVEESRTAIVDQEPPPACTIERVEQESMPSEEAVCLGRAEEKEPTPPPQIAEGEEILVTSEAQKVVDAMCSQVEQRLEQGALASRAPINTALQVELADSSEQANSIVVEKEEEHLAVVSEVRSDLVAQIVQVELSASVKVVQPSLGDSPEPGVAVLCEQVDQDVDKGSADVSNDDQTLVESVATTTTTRTELASNATAKEMSEPSDASGGNPSVPPVQSESRPSGTKSLEDLLGAVRAASQEVAAQNAAAQSFPYSPMTMHAAACYQAIHQEAMQQACARMANSFQQQMPLVGNPYQFNPFAMYQDPAMLARFAQPGAAPVDPSGTALSAATQMPGAMSNMMTPQAPYPFAGHPMMGMQAAQAFGPGTAATSMMSPQFGYGYGGFQPMYPPGVGFVPNQMGPVMSGFQGFPPATGQSPSVLPTMQQQQQQQQQQNPPLQQQQQHVENTSPAKATVSVFNVSFDSAIVEEMQSELVKAGLQDKCSVARINNPLMAILQACSSLGSQVAGQVPKSLLLEANSQHPLIWSGVIELRAHSFQVQAYFLSGRMAKAPLLIASLAAYNERSAVLSLSRRIQYKTAVLQDLEQRSATFMLCLISQATLADMTAQWELFAERIVKYLLDKNAIGVITNSEKACAMTLLPPTDEVQALFKRKAPVLHELLAVVQVPYLVIAVSTYQCTTSD